MKKTFEGQIHEEIPLDWDLKTAKNPWLNSLVLNAAKNSSNKFFLVTHPNYCCCEYKQTINLFTFGRLKFSIPFTVIGPPISVGESGFTGDIQSLVSDYKKRKGLFLMLNLSMENFDKPMPQGRFSWLYATEQKSQGKLKKPQGRFFWSSTTVPREPSPWHAVPREPSPWHAVPREPSPWLPGLAIGRTLPASVFDNTFETFEEYLMAIRSPYRRRINKALDRAKALKWEKIKSCDFDDRMYALYLNVLGRSKYPLETLSLQFFKEFDGEIHVLYQGNEPLAFVLVKWDVSTRKNEFIEKENLFRINQYELQYPNNSRVANQYELQYPDNSCVANQCELKYSDNLYTMRQKKLFFVFGGMNYDFRDKYDLYYNMLLKILEFGIVGNASVIDFGQTAEGSKGRIGCHLIDKYMMFFSGNIVVNILARAFSGFLEYIPPKENYHIWKSEH